MSDCLPRMFGADAALHAVLPDMPFSQEEIDRNLANQDSFLFLDLGLSIEQLVELSVLRGKSPECKILPFEGEAFTQESELPQWKMLCVRPNTAQVTPSRIATAREVMSLAMIVERYNAKLSPLFGVLTSSVSNSGSPIAVSTRSAVDILNYDTPLLWQLTPDQTAPKVATIIRSFD